MATEHNTPLNPLSNFPVKGKIISILLLIAIAFIFYQWYKEEQPKPLKPGTKEYEFIHYLDTLDESWNDTTTPTVICHYWYIDSNNVWHERNCGDTTCWIHKHDKSERTDSTDYLKHHNK